MLNQRRFTFTPLPLPPAYPRYAPTLSVANGSLAIDGARLPSVGYPRAQVRVRSQTAGFSRFGSPSPFNASRNLAMVGAIGGAPPAAQHPFRAGGTLRGY